LPRLGTYQLNSALVGPNLQEGRDELLSDVSDLLAVCLYHFEAPKRTRGGKITEKRGQKHSQFNAGKGLVSVLGNLVEEDVEGVQARFPQFVSRVSEAAVEWLVAEDV
jgi:hypothetical protein